MAARIPASLHAATEAPTPEPQTSTPRSASPSLIAAPSSARLVGIVDAHRVGVGAEVDGLVPLLASVSRIALAELDATVVERHCDFHATDRT